MPKRTPGLTPTATSGSEAPSYTQDLSPGWGGTAKPDTPFFLMPGSRISLDIDRPLLRKQNPPVFL